jgi:hypothetical protein
MRHYRKLSRAARTASTARTSPDSFGIWFRDLPKWRCATFLDALTVWAMVGTSPSKATREDRDAQQDSRSSFFCGPQSLPHANRAVNYPANSRTSFCGS